MSYKSVFYLTILAQHTNIVHRQAAYRNGEPHIDREHFS